MNENIDLTKILKNCPEGTKFYSPLFGEVTFIGISDDVNSNFRIITLDKEKCNRTFTSDGRYELINKECLIFPSKDQRDWSKFTASWYKKERFDPKTLKPFDKVLSFWNNTWWCDFFSHINENNKPKIFGCLTTGYTSECIPYNDETKHLAGTSEEAPEFYKYWED